MALPSCLDGRAAPPTGYLRIFTGWKLTGRCGATSYWCVGSPFGSSDFVSRAVPTTVHGSTCANLIVSLGELCDVQVFDSRQGDCRDRVHADRDERPRPAGGAKH